MLNFFNEKSLLFSFYVYFCRAYEFLTVRQ